MLILNKFKTIIIIVHVKYKLNFDNNVIIINYLVSVLLDFFYDLIFLSRNTYL